MNGRTLKEGQWEDRKQCSLGVGERRKSFKTGDDDDDSCHPHLGTCRTVTLVFVVPCQRIVPPNYADSC
jgi:hypothetical protein